MSCRGLSSRASLWWLPLTCAVLLTRSSAAGSLLRVTQASTPQELVGLIRSRAPVIEVIEHLDLTSTPTNGLPKTWRLPNSAEVAIYGNCTSGPPTALNIPDGYKYPGACYLYLGHQLEQSEPYFDATASQGSQGSRWFWSNLVLYAAGDIHSGIAFSGSAGSFFFDHMVFSGFYGQAIQLSDLDRLQLTESAIVNCGGGTGTAVALTTSDANPSGQPAVILIASDYMYATYYSGGLVQDSPSSSAFTIAVDNITSSVVPDASTTVCSANTLVCFTVLPQPAGVYSNEPELFGLPTGLSRSAAVSPLSALPYSQVAPDNDTSNWLATLQQVSVPGVAESLDPFGLTSAQPGTLGTTAPGGAPGQSPTTPTAESGSAGTVPLSSAAAMGRDVIALTAIAVACALLLCAAD